MAQTSDGVFLLQTLPRTDLVTNEVYPEDSIPVVRGEVKARKVPECRYKGDYQFGPDSFSRCLPLWEQAMKTFKGKPDLHYLEVGVYQGRSVFWVLENICTHPTARVTAIDVEDPPELLFNINASGVGKRFTFIKGFSQVELRKIPLESCDMIYIDGDHQAQAVLEDAILSWRLLKPGGLLIFDDYALMLHGPPLSRPNTAIDSFYRYFGEHIEPVHVGYQVILKKKPAVRN
jgi:hypothetical protein